MPLSRAAGDDDASIRGKQFDQPGEAVRFPALAVESRPRCNQDAPGRPRLPQAFAVGKLIVCGFRVLEQYRIAWFIGAYICWRMKDRGQCRLNLERYALPDYKRFEREREELEKQLREFWFLKGDLKALARACVEHHGDGSDANPAYTEINWDAFDAPTLVRLVEEAIAAKQKAEEQPNG